MKVNVLARFVTIICMLFSMQSLALTETNPYRGLVLVDEQNPEQQTEELLRVRALNQVLIKVSGNTEVVNLDETKTLAKKIPSMLAQFGYQDEANARYYYALFDKRKIDQALIAMQQPVWGSTRPNTLIWLVNEQRKITSDQEVKSSQDVALSWGLKKAELKRGITVQFPLGDLDDSIAINASDITGRFYDTASQASQRYRSDYFVLANLSQSFDGKWKLDWQLIHDIGSDKLKPVVASDSNRGSKSYVMSALVSGIADYYAKQFAILENDGEKYTQQIQVEGVDSLAKLTQLNEMLARLNAIDSYKVVQINATKVDLLITLKGSIASLNNALNAQAKLVKSTTSSDAFHYQWTP